jgi:hypothetical protein
MASNSNKLIGSLDIAGLVDLLNSSDGLNENTTPILTGPVAQVPVLQPKNGPEEVTAIPPTQSDPVKLLPTDQHAAGEYRFATQVVSGMSKLKRV